MDTHQTTNTQTQSLGQFEDLRQQITSGMPFEEITILLPGERVRRPLTEFEVALLRANLPRDADS
ncbi:hypothetical protein D0962_37815 [Leptolyngbyaceae cyanobacterium CCMR0082]|uniref:Uncharacterized protein n=1 Tax=Adonisia turfae CCMR0082 TaxID=2304604 RepID=A0A6M0SKP1_9CYAN|nr:hypothetical protein [Adonisia turfae CCMR0082]